MQHFAPEERGNLSSSVIGFHNEWVEDRIHGPLVAGLRLTPASLQMIIEDLQTLRQVLQSTRGC